MEEKKARGQESEPLHLPISQPLASSTNLSPHNPIISSPLFGFLNIYKTTGMTSHDVVAILRRITKIKQIGHTGTLDPFAQGVLPIAIGKATRLIEFLEDDKEYLAEISFGKSTNTYDCEGEATFLSEKKVALSDILSGLKAFEGEIMQTPPIFSALKVNGKKLYEYARKGETVQIQPRKVTIEKIELKNFDENNQMAQVLIKCSKGTYIRSIAHDLGENLKAGAHLSKLIRTQAGKFFVNNSIPLDNAGFEDIKKHIIQPIEILPQEKFDLTEDEQKKVMMGQKLKKNIQDAENIILVYNGKISAIAQANEGNIKVKKVFEV